MPQRLSTLLLLISALLLTPALAAEDDAKAAPAQSGTAWWWDDAWWEQGQIPAATNYPVETRWVTYMSGDTEIPALVARPRGKGKFPAVLYMHGRRGLGMKRQYSNFCAASFRGVGDTSTKNSWATTGACPTMCCCGPSAAWTALAA